MEKPSQEIMNHGPDQIEVEAKTIDTSLAELVTRAEYDVQISTAKKYPRSIKAFMSQALEMVTLNEDIAQECSYAIPRGGKIIKGPSVRFAEIILHAWGHSRAGARIVNEDSRYVTAQGVCHDLQTNTLIAFEVRRRITDSKGKRYNDDMIGVTGNAASSIALRNAILRVIPKALWQSLYDAAQRCVIGDIKTLSERRARAMATLAKYGVLKERVFARLEIKGEEDITLDHLDTLFGLMTAIKDEQITPEDAFPPTEAELAAHVKEVSAGLNAAAGEPEKAKPVDNNAADFALALDDLILGLNALKAPNELGPFCEENGELLKGISEKAPKELQQKWADAHHKKMETFRKKDSPAKKA